MSARPAWIRSVLPLAAADLRHRYAGSALGALWAVAGPLVEVLAYAVVFGLLLSTNARGSGIRYAVFIASGLLPWAALREALESSAASLPDNRWMRRSRIPLELVIARQVLQASVRAFIGLAVVIVAAGVMHGPVELARTLPWPLLAFGLQVVLCYGIGIALAPLGTLHPDLRPALSSLLTLLTFGSPILFPENVVGARVLAVLDWNPFTRLLRFYRSPLEGQLPAVADGVVVALWVLFAVGAGMFLKDRFWWTARDRL